MCVYVRIQIHSVSVISPIQSIIHLLLLDVVPIFLFLVKILFNLKFEFKFIFWISFLYWNQGYVTGSVQEPTQPRLCFYGMIVHLGEEGKRNGSFYLHYHLMSEYGCSEENYESMIWRTVKLKSGTVFGTELYFFCRIISTDSKKNWHLWWCKSASFEYQTTGTTCFSRCSAFVHKAHFNLLLNLGTFGKVPHYFMSKKNFNLPGVYWFLVPNKHFDEFKKKILRCDLWKIKYTFYFNKTDYPSGFD